MSKNIVATIALALVVLALVACTTGGTPTPTKPTIAPTRTTVPTATRVPTVTPKPAPSATPETDRNQILVRVEKLTDPTWPTNAKPITPCFSIPSCIINNQWEYTGGIVGSLDLKHRQLNLIIRVTVNDKETSIQPGNGRGFTISNEESWGVVFKFNDNKKDQEYRLYFKASIWNDAIRNWGKVTISNP